MAIHQLAKKEKMSPELTSALVSEVIKITPVIVGAFVALAAQWVSHKYNVKRERTKLFREKVEAFGLSIYEYSNWMNGLETHCTLKDSSHETQSPIGKCWLLQKLYFPELKEPLGDLYRAGIKHEHIVRDNQLMRLKNEIAWLNTYDRTVRNDSYVNFFNAHEALLNKLAAVKALSSDVS